MEQLTISGNTITSIENFTPALLQKENTYLEIIKCAPDPSEEELKIYLEEQWRKEDEKRAAWAAEEEAAKNENEWIIKILDKASAEAKTHNSALQKAKEVEKLKQQKEAGTLVEFFESVKRTNDNHHPVYLNTLLKRATESTVLKTKTEKFRTWLNDNPDLTKQQKSEEKVKTFTSVTFSGTFGGTGKASEIKQLSGLVVLDLDHITDTNQRTFEEIRKLLENDKYVFLLFVSPSGDGIKLVIKHDLTEASKWEKLCLSIEKYFKDKHCLKVDGSGKDISRQCFIPYTEKLYRNDKSAVWIYDNYLVNTNTTKDNYSDNVNTNTNINSDNLKTNDNSYPDSIKTNDDNNSTNTTTNDDHHSDDTNNEINDDLSLETNQTSITDELSTECLYMSEFIKEKRINFTESYPDWLSEGFSLCSLGETGREIFHNLSSVSKKYDKTECDNQYDKCLHNYNDTKTGINKFLITAKEAINKYVNKQISSEITLPRLEIYSKLPNILQIPLRKYDNAQKFMALLANIGNISGILSNIRFIHNGGNEYESNMYIWIIGKSGIGKNTINDARKNFSEIEKFIDNENYTAKQEYDKKKSDALTKIEPFNEHQPVQKALYIGADLNKPTLARELKRNNCRAIINATEAKTLVVSNKAISGNFSDILLACWEHEFYQKDLSDYSITLKETYLSMVLGSTNDTACDFFNDTNIENGMYSRFLAFKINVENAIKIIKANSLRENYIEENENNKKHFLNIWQDCLKLEKQVYLNLPYETDVEIFKKYEILQKEVKYIYKFCNPDAVIRIWIMHKRLVLLLSALYHYEKKFRINIDDLDYGLEVDPRALEIAEIIMKIYRESFIQLGFSIEKFKHKNMLPYQQKHLITKMKFEGHSEEYLSMLFDLPLKMIKNGENTDEIKSRCLEFLKDQNEIKLELKKKIVAKILGVSVRTIQIYCKKNNIEK